MKSWRSIPDFPLYEASDDGLIRRVGTSDPLSACVDDRGYAKVTLPDPCGVIRSVWVHRLVCSAFHGPANGREARHLSGDNTDNGQGNLRWGSRAENVADRKRHMAEKSLPYAGLRPHRRIKSLPDARGALGRFLGAPRTLGGIRKAYRQGLINKTKALELIESL